MSCMPEPKWPPETVADLKAAAYRSAETSAGFAELLETMRPSIVNPEPRYPGRNRHERRKARALAATG